MVTCDTNLKKLDRAGQGVYRYFWLGAGPGLRLFIEKCLLERMTGMARKGTLVVLSLAAFILTIAVAGCSKPGVSKANFDKVKNGMTLVEVQKILGEGKKGISITSTFGKLVGQGTTYVWEKDDIKISIIFKDDKVISKNALGLEEKK